jgi:hypothetical protein
MAEIRESLDDLKVALKEDEPPEDGFDLEDEYDFEGAEDDAVADHDAWVEETRTELDALGLGVEHDEDNMEMDDAPPVITVEPPAGAEKMKMDSAPPAIANQASAKDNSYP